MSLQDVTAFVSTGHASDHNVLHDFHQWAANNTHIVLDTSFGDDSKAHPHPVKTWAEAVSRLNSSSAGGLIEIIGTADAPVTATQSTSKPVKVWARKGGARLRLDQPGITALQLDADFSHVSGLRIGVSSTTATGQRGIVANAKNICLENINIQNFGRDVTTGYEVEDSLRPIPILWKGPGGTALSDWGRAVSIHLFNCYSGMVVLAGGTGHLSDYVCRAHQVGCGLYIERGASQVNSPWRVQSGHVVNGGWTTGVDPGGIRDWGYAVYLRQTDPTTGGMVTTFEMFRSEGWVAGPLASPPKAHFFIDSKDVIFSGPTVMNRGAAGFEFGANVDATVMVDREMVAHTLVPNLYIGSTKHLADLGGFFPRTTTERNAYSTGWGTNQAGKTCYDSTLGKPVLWSGSAWIDFTGAAA